MKAIWFIVNSIVVLVMMSIVGLFLMPYLPFEHNIELRIVESGSMEPAIMTGALVVIRPTASYAVGDVITFEERGADVPTTHRIVEERQENGRTVFVTKGDANEEADPRVVTSRQILGAVAFDVPRVGFVLDFARQPIGFLLLIVLPALLIVLSEIEKIWREVRARGRHEEEGEESGGPTGELAPVKATVVEVGSVRKSMMDIATPVRYLNLPTLDLRRMKPYKTSVYTQRQRLPRLTAALPAIVFSVLVFSSGFLGSTVSYFNDIETSAHNLLGAISLDSNVVADVQLFAFIDDTLSDDTIEITVTPESGSAPAHYDISTITGSSSPLCDAIVADAGVPVSTAASLLSLSANDVTFAGPMTIQFSLPDETGLVGGETCDAEIVFDAWHEEMVGEGYSDIETIPLSFTYTKTTPAPVSNVAPDGSITPPPAAGNVSPPTTPTVPVVSDETTGGTPGGGGNTAPIGTDGEGTTGTQDEPSDPPTTGGGQGGNDGDANTDPTGSISSSAPAPVAFSLLVETTEEEGEQAEEESEELEKDEVVPGPSILPGSSDPESVKDKEEVKDEPVVDEVVAEPVIEDTVE